MKLYTPKTPAVLPKLYTQYKWRYHTDKKIIYLTFDDGPTKGITDFVLNQLEQYNAKATFFCIGKNVVAQHELYQNIIRNGHAVGNHTYDHIKGWKSKTADYLENIDRAGKHINSALFRPPYGKIKKKQAKKLVKEGYQIIMWDVLSADFDTGISKEKCLENVLTNTQPGSIVVFHDSIKAQEKVRFVLPKVLDHFTKKGYVFKAIS